MPPPDIGAPPPPGIGTVTICITIPYTRPASSPATTPAPVFERIAISPLTVVVWDPKGPLEPGGAIRR
jgi:hypothetical protein